MKVIKQAPFFVPTILAFTIAHGIDSPPQLLPPLESFRTGPLRVARVCVYINKSDCFMCVCLCVRSGVFDGDCEKVSSSSEDTSSLSVLPAHVPM
jgi:hypothetical protein